MQPNGNVIVDTICRTAKLGTTITGATENGDVTVIEAEPVEPINECPTCGQPGVYRRAREPSRPNGRHPMR